MPKTTVLAFDVGGTKTAWGLVDEEGKVQKSDIFPTPHNRDEFLSALKKVLVNHKDIAAVGIGVAGTVSADHRGTLVCTNIPELSHLHLADEVQKSTNKPVAIDNDGRCALIGEVWKGSAQDTSSSVFITIGTGVGGAVLQRYKVLPHPQDLSLEISHLIADPSDLFPARSGQGTVEALIGGKNLEERFGISLADASKNADKPEYEELWMFVQEAFLKSVKSIHETYSCAQIIVGGKGVKDLPLYIGSNEMPCPVVPAKLGAEAGVLGAARIALDAAEEAEKDWDEE